MCGGLPTGGQSGLQSEWLSAGWSRSPHCLIYSFHHSGIEHCRRETWITLKLDRNDVWMTISRLKTRFFTFLWDLVEMFQRRTDSNKSYQIHCLSLDSRSSATQKDTLVTIKYLMHHVTSCIYCNWNSIPETQQHKLKFQSDSGVG